MGYELIKNEQILDRNFLSKRLFQSFNKDKNAPFSPPDCHKSQSY